MFRAVIAIALLLSCTAPAPTTVVPTPSPTREPGTYAVTVLLDLSGSRGPRGDTQRSAMQQWVDAQRGEPRVKVRFVDAAGSDAKLLVELKRSADAGDADAFVIGVPATIDDPLVSAIALVKRPVLFTMPIAVPVGDLARWMFGLAPIPISLARAMAAALPARSTPAVIVTSGTLASGREEQSLTAAFREEGRPMPFVLSAAPEVRDTFSQRAKPYFNSSTALYFAGPAASYLDPQRLLPDPAASGPVFLSYLTDPTDASRLGDTASAVLWPGLRRPTAAGIATHAATATDALALLAAKADPTGDPERTRARIEGGTFAGIATTYAFSASQHIGVDPREIALLAWQGGRAVIAR